MMILVSAAVWSPFLQLSQGIIAHAHGCLLIAEFVIFYVVGMYTY